MQPGDVSEVMLGPDPDCRSGPEPGTAGVHRRRHPGRRAGLGHEPGVRLGPARGRARRPADRSSAPPTIVVAGGQESMSQAPHCAPTCATAPRWARSKFIDTMIKDGLWDAFNGYHMGNTAENVARQWQITREEQDSFAVASQNKAEAAKKAGKFKDEIVPVTIKTQQGRDGRRRGRVHQDGVTYDSRRQAAARFRQGRHRHRRQRSRHQRRRRRRGADDARGGAEARHRAARPHRLVGARRRRSLDHGHGADPGLEEGAREGRLDRQGPRPRSRPTRPSPRRPAPSTRASAGTPTRSTSTAAPSPSATRSALRARACSPRCCIEMKRRNAKKGLATLCIGGGMGVAMCVERD